MGKYLPAPHSVAVEEENFYNFWMILRVFRRASLSVILLTYESEGIFIINLRKTRVSVKN